LNTNRGFTLIEVLVTAGILVCGLVAVASVFSFVIRTTATNKQAAVAATLLYDKMEELRSASLTDAAWANATGSQTVNIAGESYVRTWRVGGGVPRVVTVVIYAKSNSWTGRQVEVMRAATLVSPTF
jgi:Tfp pilus assembly protein PilV